MTPKTFSIVCSIAFGFIVPLGIALKTSDLHADVNSKKPLVQSSKKPFEPQLNSDEYRMVISLPQKTFGKGPVMLTCEFQNRSEKPVVIYHCDFGPNHGIVLKDETGNEPAPTKLGLFLKEVFKTGNRDRTAPARVSPGKTSSETIDLARCYDLKPGKYRVKVLFREHARKIMKAKTEESIMIKLESNELEFEIKS